MTNITNLNDEFNSELIKQTRMRSKNINKLQNTFYMQNKKKKESEKKLLNAELYNALCKDYLLNTDKYKLFKADNVQRVLKKNCYIKSDDYSHDYFINSTIELKFDDISIIKCVTFGDCAYPKNRIDSDIASQYSLHSFNSILNKYNLEFTELEYIVLSSFIRMFKERNDSFHWKTNNIQDMWKCVVDYILDFKQFTNYVLYLADIKNNSSGYSDEESSEYKDETISNGGSSDSSDENSNENSNEDGNDDSNENQ